MAQGVSLDAVFALTISQNAGALGGTYSITGTLSDGFDSVSIQGTGTLSGAIGSGTNPSVSLTVLTAGCASHPASFTGGFDTANQRLTLTGPVRIFDTACNVLLTYPTTITLTR